MRRTVLLSALTAAALVAVALAGCTPSASRGPGNQPAGCSPTLASGHTSSVVKATGKVGGTPKATFPTPLVGHAAQVTVLKAGHGTPAPSGGQVSFKATVFNGKTGASLGSETGITAADFPLQGQATTLTKALTCAQTGARLALTTTAKASFGAGSLTQYGVSDSSTVVVVLDIVATYLGKANGINQLPQDGMPNVITAVDGQPGIVLQELQKPTTARSEVVKAGGGAVLKKGQTAIALFTTWTWPADGDKPAVVDKLDAWSQRAAGGFPLTKNGGLPAKLVSALVGQKVGSQVLVVLPPKDGFPASAVSSYDVTSKDTLIFVVDILGVQK